MSLAFSEFGVKPRLAENRCQLYCNYGAALTAGGGIAAQSQVHLAVDGATAMRFVVSARSALETFGFAVECLLAVVIALACASARAQAQTPSANDELAAIRRRLDVIEADNAQLARENAALRQSISAAEFSPHTFVADDASLPPVPMELEAELQKLGGAVEELGAGMQEMKTGVEQLADALRVTTLREYSKIAIFGELRGETLWSNARPVVPSSALLLAPAPLVPGFDDDTFAVGSKPSLLGLGFQGPEIGCFETGGLILACLYSETIVKDIYGIAPLLAYGEIKNQDFRFLAGLNVDVFNPLNPTMVNFLTLWASGNTGAYRGQVRVERYLYPTCDSQITIQADIGDPIPTTIVDNRFLGAVITEDNGWPNVEGRIAYGLGELQGAGTEAKRPVEFGLSGLIGEIRSTNLLINQVVTSTWGIGCDARVQMTDRFGVQGELFRGRTLGTYLGGVAQTVNSTTLEGIHSQGGFGEAYYYFNPCVHVHFGYGVDDPDDGDLAATQITYNETLYGTVFWEVTEALRLGLEISHRETDYVALPDNEGILVHTQVQWSF
jgi:hypothetical protein